MDWLTNWDDLIHGTAVFGAAVPLCTALLVGFILRRQVWIAVAAGIAIPLLWLFNLPPFPPSSSDHIMVSGLVVAAAVSAWETGTLLSWWKRPLLRFMAFSALAWPLYPAWLAEEGGDSRRLLVAAGMGLTISIWASVMELLMRKEGGDLHRGIKITPAALVPPTIALSALLQLGGSMQFAQSAGALASATGAVCLLLIWMWETGGGGLKPMAAFWGMMFGLMAWSGWLFAEINLIALFLLLPAPFFALLANLFPYNRMKTVQLLIWDTVLAGLIAGFAAWLAWQQYKGDGDSMGY